MPCGFLAFIGTHCNSLTLHYIKAVAQRERNMGMEGEMDEKDRAKHMMELADAKVFWFCIGAFVVLMWATIFWGD